MHSRLSHWRAYLPTVKQVLAAVVATQLLVATPLRAQTDTGSNDGKTTSPIKHVIIIIGENRTFRSHLCHLQAQEGATVDNLLSRGIINAGRHARSEFCAVGSNILRRTPTRSRKVPDRRRSYPTLPPPRTVAAQVDVVQRQRYLHSGRCDGVGKWICLPTYYPFLLTGGTGSGQMKKTADQRIAEREQSAAGAVPTDLQHFPYDSYAASPVHRFYQMWQQIDCNVGYAHRQGSGRVQKRTCFRGWK